MRLNYTGIECEKMLDGSKILAACFTKWRKREHNFMLACVLRCYFIVHVYSITGFNRLKLYIELIQFILKSEYASFET